MATAKDASSPMVLISFLWLPRDSSGSRYWWRLLRIMARNMKNWKPTGYGTRAQCHLTRVFWFRIEMRLRLVVGRRFRLFFLEVWLQSLCRLKLFLVRLFLLLRLSVSSPRIRDYSHSCGLLRW